MANILIATGADGHARMREILAGSHNLVFAKTVQEALEAAKNCDLLLCGLEFDESQMFDFLRVLNADPTLKSKPRVCVRFIATNTPENVIGGLELAARAVGAKGLIDLPSLDAQHGTQGANEKLRAEIEETLNGHRK
jgi:CheY-like chemotaxis protein